MRDHATAHVRSYDANDDGSLTVNEFTKACYPEDFHGEARDAISEKHELSLV